MQTLKWIGIDYGSKLAGTTVIAYEQKGTIHFKQSEKKQDTDEMILTFISEWNVGHVFIDAPLSIPLAYYGKAEDYFYRQADIEAKAMSPMFLGGLTARAMRLKSQCPSAKFYESYPKMVIKQVLNLQAYNKKEKFYPIILEEKPIRHQFKFSNPIQNWHQFDALMAWYIGDRYFKDDAQNLGDPEEGLIWF